MSEHGYKSKTIRKILHAKINHWLKTIDDLDVRMLLERDVIVTGGSIVSMLMGEEIKDFDVYFKTEEATVAAAKYYCDVFKSQNPNAHWTPQIIAADGRVEIKISSIGAVESEDANETPEGIYEANLGEGGADVFVEANITSRNKSDGVEKPSYRPIFISSNAITLSDKVQLVTRFYGSAEQIHENYDFEHCKNVYDFKSDELHLKSSALESMMSKTLLYTGSLYPICSLFRMRKFIDRGWRISAGEILKMAWQVNALNLKDVKVIKEQLTGCDQAYMRHLIVAMESELTKNPDFSIDQCYIVELVDKVFNT